MTSGSNKLDDPSSILLSASAARAFFGDKDPISKIMKVDNNLQVKVTGVYEDLPLNSSFAELDFIMTWELVYNNTQWIKTMEDPWRPNAFTLFVQLNDNGDFNLVSAK